MSEKHVIWVQLLGSAPYYRLIEVVRVAQNFAKGWPMILPFANTLWKDRWEGNFVSVPFRGVSSPVECLLAKEKVTGSIPVRRSMTTVYILENSKSRRHYIGSTDNLKRRISEHNRGQTKSTKQKGFWIILYKEEYLSRIDARKREQQIKAYKGGNAFKKLIER